MADFSITPKDASSTTDYIISQLKGLLMDGRIKPGDRLPSEFELAQQFGVSRGSIRSAMKVFETCGVVDIRRGDGTYISSGLQNNTMMPLLLSLYVLNPTFDAMVQFREKIELDIFDLAMRNKEEKEDLLKELRANLRTMRTLQKNEAEPAAFSANDADFHKIIAHHCGNILFESVYSYVMEFFLPSIHSTHVRQVSGSIAAKTHFQIYEALREDDFSKGKDAIQAAMKDWYNLAGEAARTGEDVPLASGK